MTFYRGAVVNTTTNFVVNIISAQLDFNPGPGLIFVPHETANIGDRYVPATQEILAQPSPYYVFDDDLVEWVYSHELFNAELFDTLDQHRDFYISQVSEVSLTWDSGGPNEEVLTLLSDNRTMEAVGRKCIVAPIKDEVFTVNYKFHGYTPRNIFDVGYREVTTDFLQDFYVLMDAENQKYFDAEKYILSVHEATPYTEVYEATVDYDNYILNN